MVSLSELNKLFWGTLKIYEPLARYTTFRVGGPADYYMEPSSKEDLVQIIRYLRSVDVPFIFIRKGSNLLVSDEGFRGAVINLDPGLARLHAEDNDVYAEAGVPIAKLVDYCILRSLQGVETLAGIPGTIGGGVVTNAGTEGGNISDHLMEVELMRDGEVKALARDQLQLAHRGADRDIVLAARFRLHEGDREILMRIRRELLVRRGRIHPITLPDAGNVFKNPLGSFAGLIVQECGLKGRRVGGAMVSEQHANFIVNTGNATAVDILELIRLVQSIVCKKTGILLETEVKMIGVEESVFSQVD
jgi:UDP-N-acetylmuramate dehydrogenase